MTRSRAEGGCREGTGVGAARPATWITTAGAGLCLAFVVGGLAGPARADPGAHQGTTGGTSLGEVFRLPEVTGGSFLGLPPPAQRIALDPLDNVAWRTVDQMIPYELRKKGDGTRVGGFEVHVKQEFGYGPDGLRWLGPPESSIVTDIPGTAPVRVELVSPGTLSPETIDRDRGARILHLGNTFGIDNRGTQTLTLGSPVPGTSAVDFPPGKALWSTVTKLYPNGTYSTYDGLGTYFKKNLDGSVSRDNWYLPAGTVPGQFDDAD